MLKAFLAHCDSGTNYFTGAKGVRLDFVSVHEKGAGATPEDVDPDTLGLCRREEALVEYIRKNHPRLAQVPIMNNECDPIVGWAHAHTWHARPYYAAQVCRSLDLHLRRLVDGMGARYELLGNDHGFLGPWGNRTLVARFGDEQRAQLRPDPPQVSGIDPLEPLPHRGFAGRVRPGELAAQFQPLGRGPGRRVHAVGDRTDRHLAGVEAGPQLVEHVAADAAVQQRDPVRPLRQPQPHVRHVEHRRVVLGAEGDDPGQRHPGQQLGPARVTEVPLHHLDGEDRKSVV
jgi:hypothetical protein